MGSFKASAHQLRWSTLGCRSLLLVAFMAYGLFAACTTEVHYHEEASDAATTSSIDTGGSTGNSTSDTPPVSTPDTPVDQPDTSTPPDTGGPPVPPDTTGTSDYLECPDGWQPNSTGEGCAPICAAGTELNADENGCVPVGSPDDTGTEPTPLECPAGYEEIEVDGTAVCAPSTSVTIHGYALDASTGLGIADVSVTINALGPEPLTTDATGYFEVTGVTQVGEFALYYEAAGYHSSYQWVSVQSGSAGAPGEVFIDATNAMVAVTQESIETPPEADGWISGTVYAGDAPAVGATVRLRYATTGAEAGSTLTDANGDFMIGEVVVDGHTFDLLVDNHDIDGDGVFDYQGQSIDVGSINEGTSSINASNVIVVLSAFAKSLTYVNFTPPLMDVPGPGTYAGLQFASPGADMLFHFGSETQPDTLVFSLVERVAGAVVGTMGAAASWNDAGTVLTLNPSGLLTQDADPSTDYELRIEALLWSDGSAFVPLDAGASGAARFQFQVGEAPTYLINPSPTIYTDNLGTDEQDVALVSCDARVCWLYDGDNYPIGGPVDPSIGGASEAHINGTDGFQLTWGPVAGATGYKVYARQSYDGPEAAGLQGWVEVETSSIVTGTFSAGAATTVYATGILATGSPTWTDFGAGGAPGVGNTLAFGNVIELAVTAIDGLGLESPIDEGKTLALIDVTSVGIVSVSGVDPETTASGNYEAVKSYDVSFSELVDPSANAFWSLTSRRVLSMTQPDETTWGNSDVFSGDNVSETGRFDRMYLDMRWPCASLTEDADGTQTRVKVNDVSLFPSGAGVEVMFLSGTNGGQAAHPGVRNVFSSDSGTGEIEFFNALEANGGNALSEGDFVCVILPQYDGLELDANDLSVSGGPLTTVGNIASTEPVHLFHINQPVVVIYKKETEPGVFGISVYETTVTDVQRPIYNGGFIQQLGRLYLSSSPPENYASTTIFARPTHEPTFRKVTEMALNTDIASDFGTPPITQLEIVPGTMSSSTCMPGDLLLIDVDGDMDTVSDRHFAELDYLDARYDDPVTPTDETDYRAGLVAAGLNTTALPTNIELTAGETRILCLGDTFALTGLTDTSGNVGLNAFRDQFSFCDGSLPECDANGLFIY